jgi:hypothetical protein
MLIRYTHVELWHYTHVEIFSNTLQYLIEVSMSPVGLSNSARFNTVECFKPKANVGLHQSAIAVNKLVESNHTNGKPALVSTWKKN